MDDVIETLAFLVPEAAKAAARAGQQGFAKTLLAQIVHAAGGSKHDVQRVEPERVDLDRLADARREYLIAILGIHPRQLRPRFAGVQESVLLIDMSAVARAIGMRVNDGHQRGKQLGEQLRIGLGLQVVLQRMKHPQRRIRRVVFRSLAAVRKPVRQHAAIDEGGIGLQDVGGNVVATQGGREPGQRNHGVAAPVRKPGIAGDDAGRRGAGGAPAHDELIGCAGQGANPIRRALWQACGQDLAVVVNRLHDLASRDRRRRFGGGDEEERNSRLELRAEAAGKEQILRRIESTQRLLAVPETPVPGGRRREPPLRNEEAIRLSRGSRPNAALIRTGRQFKGLCAVAMTVIVAVRDIGFERDAHRRRVSQ